MDYNRERGPYGPYSALGPFTESEQELENLIQETHASWYLRVCEGQAGHSTYRWIIDYSGGRTICNALGPFVFKQVQGIGMPNPPWVSCIVLEQNQFVETNGFGVVCLERNIKDTFWVICMPFGRIPRATDPRTQIDTLSTHIATGSGSGRQAHDELHPYTEVLEASAGGRGRDPSRMEWSETDDCTQLPGNIDTAGGDGEVATISENGHGSVQAHDEYPASVILEASVDGGRDPSGLERFQTDDFTQPGNFDTTGGDVATIPGENGYGLEQALDGLPSVIRDESAFWDREGFGMGRFQTYDFTQLGLLGNVDTSGGEDGSYGEAGGFPDVHFSVGEGFAGGAPNGDEVPDLQTSDGEARGVQDMHFRTVDEGFAVVAAYGDQFLDLESSDDEAGGYQNIPLSSVGEGSAGGAANGDQFPDLETSDGEARGFQDMLLNIGGAGFAGGASYGEYEIPDLQPGDGGGGAAKGAEIPDLQPVYLQQLDYGGGEAVYGDGMLDDVQLGDGAGGAPSGAEIQNLQSRDGGGGAASEAENLNLQPGDGGEQGLPTEDQNVQDQAQPAVTKSSRKCKGKNIVEDQGDRPAVTKSSRKSKGKNILEDQGQPSGTKSARKKAKTAREPVMQKHHGVTPREENRQRTFVAYFRPSTLPESDKKFVFVGEFQSEDEAWYGFNLFSWVHEGIPSYEKITNNETKEKLEVEVEFWREFHRVDLLAHLRLQGRGKSLYEGPDYRNVKIRSSNSKGLVWSADVILPKDIIDPMACEGMRNTRTFDSSHEAAKEADRLMYLKDGLMAWTNFALTDCILPQDKIEEILPKIWIPLQDNPRRYLKQ